MVLVFAYGFGEVLKEKKEVWQKGEADWNDNYPKVSVFDDLGKPITLLSQHHKNPNNVLKGLWSSWEMYMQINLSWLHASSFTYKHSFDLLVLKKTRISAACCKFVWEVSPFLLSASDSWNRRRSVLRRMFSQQPWICGKAKCSSLQSLLSSVYCFCLPGVDSHPFPTKWPTGDLSVQLCSADESVAFQLTVCLSTLLSLTLHSWKTYGTSLFCFFFSLSPVSLLGQPTKSLDFEQA